MIARPKRQAPDARAQLVAFARDYAKHEADLERSGERLRAERDKAIRAAYQGGLPMSAIAQVMELSHQRVSQIVRS